MKSQKSKQPVNEEDRTVVVALRFTNHAAMVHMDSLMERIRHHVAVQLHQEVELVGFAITDGDNMCTRNGTVQVVDLVRGPNA